MIFAVDKCLAAAAMIQAIVATLRASSRLDRMLDRAGGDDVMQGPLIVPPYYKTPSNETVESEIKKSSPSSLLWELSDAFRHVVALALNRDEYNYEYEINDMVLPGTRVLQSPSSKKQHTLSPFRDYFNSAYEDEIDDEIDFLLQRIDTFDERHRKGVGSKGSSSMLVAAAAASAASAYVSNSEERDTQSTSGEPIQPASGARNADPLESDFYLTLSTVKYVGNVYCRGSSASAVRPRAAQLTAFSPEGFSQLRSLFGISESSFRTSILESGPFVSFSSNSKGAARAGGVFFFTRDGKYLIKTIKQDEVPALLNMLPQYYNYMQRNAKRSLLTRYCGMYEVTFRDQGDEKPYTFVVMNSVFPARASSCLTERYDLKGSTVGRECPIEERESKGNQACLLDLDLAREVELIKSLQKRGRYDPSHGYGINIGSAAKGALMDQLRQDVAFLTACNVMDYSLLVGVERRPSSPGLASSAAMDLHSLKRGDREGKLRLQFLEKGGATYSTDTAPPNATPAFLRLFLSPPRYLARTAKSIAKNVLSLSDSSTVEQYDIHTVDAGPLTKIPGERMGNPAMYYFGLIDFLQPFNAKKFLEYRVKSFMYEPESFSCIPPKEYGKRFLTFMNEHIV